MFDLTKQSILTCASNRLAMLALAALTSAVVGACFNGNAAEGLPCNDAAQCGPGVGCINGFCAGLFLCGDGALLDATDVCDVDIDCEDGSDEDPELCGGMGVNQCEGSDGELAYRLGPSMPGPQDAIKVEAINIMGSPAPDAIVAGRDGDHVKVMYDLDTPSPQEFFFHADPPSFEDRHVVAFEVGDVNGDTMQDVVIVTTGVQTVVYVYQNMAQFDPAPFGAEIVVPDYDVGEVTVRGVKLGRLNNDSSTDIVAVLDVTGGPGLLGGGKGVLLVSTGNSAVGPMEPYFDPNIVPEMPLGYDMFVDMALADMNGDNYDDLLVVGIVQGNPRLWLVHRNPLGDSTGWQMPVPIPITFPGILAVGHFANSSAPGEPLPSMPDVAILAPNGLLLTMLNANGMLQPPSPMMTLSGSDFASLTLADINCDHQADFIYSLDQPAEIRVLFGDGLGGVLSDVPLTYADDGSPRGGLGIAKFDGDATPDIFTSADPGAMMMGSGVRVLTSKPE